MVASLLRDKLQFHVGLAVLLLLASSAAVLMGSATALGVANTDPLRYDTPIVRIKDISRIHGVRSNQIYGLGLVTGLNGTGDGASVRANIQMTANMLESFGITVSPEDLRLRNVAVVMVTADIPVSARTGDRLDVTISSIGDARSLKGGYLLQTPMKAANDEVYAAAQGVLSHGGEMPGTRGSVHPTVAVIPDGAIVEQEIPHNAVNGEFLTLVLHNPDFTTAYRLASVINQVVAPGTAQALDQASIQVAIPNEYRGNVVPFIAQLEELPVRPDALARVVVNERTGTVVMGSAVRIAQVAVAHGDLSVQVQSPAASLPAEIDSGFLQPEPDSFNGSPALEQAEPDPFAALQPEQETEVEQVMLVGGGGTVQELVDALNAIGARAQDIVAVLQAIKAAGALYGDLVVI